MEQKHLAQLEILKHLLFEPLSRFSVLNKLKLSNDHFSFHIKKLIEDGLIQKESDKYFLTPKGLQFASRMDLEHTELLEQPKIGVSLFVTRKTKGKTEVLLGQRLKDPNLGKIGLFARKVKFGQSLLDTATKCLFEETGLTGKFSFAGTYRLTQKAQGEIITDVLFTCFQVTNLSGEILTESIHSKNFWVEIEDSKKLEGIFSDYLKVVGHLQSEKIFFEEITEEIDP